MRRIATALRNLTASVARAIDVEGALILTGLAGLSFLLWTVDWRLGVALPCVFMLAAGIALARPPRTS